VATTVRLPSCGLCGGPEMSGDVVRRVSAPPPRWNEEVLDANRLVSPNDEALEAEK